MRLNCRNIREYSGSQNHLYVIADCTIVGCNGHRRRSRKSTVSVCPHNDGTNVTFCDGHSKWLNKVDQAWADTNEATNRSWNPTLP